MLKKIDKTKKEFEHIPDTLDGEVLLEVTEHGILTASEKVVAYMKMANPAQRVRLGWGRFDGIDSYDTSHVQKPDLEGYRAELIDMLHVLQDSMNVKRVSGVINAATNANSIEALMMIKHSMEDIIHEDGVALEFIDKIKHKNYKETK